MAPPDDPEPCHICGRRTHSGPQHPAPAAVQPEALPWKVWRGPDDQCCPCPYCTAVRERPAAHSGPSEWRRRMGSVV